METTKTTTKETARPASIKTQVQEILAVIQAFSNLLARETVALRKADFKAVDDLQADKRLFAKQYQEKIVALTSSRADLPNLELALREKLVKERQRFNQVLDENMKALDLAQHSTKRLINRILEAARNAVVEERQTNYSRAGKAVAYKSATMSINVDHSM